MRIIDIRTTVEVLEEAEKQPSGARRRVADRMNLQPSVITDRVHRIESEVGGELLHNDGTLTLVGRQVLESGTRIIREIDEMLKAAHDARPFEK